MKDNPYVGPRPYERQDRHNFFGREREARELRALILSEREVLFYAQSGAGKTSLLNARVIPALEVEGFLVLPLTRVGSELPPGIDASAVDNVFVFGTLLALSGEDADSQALLGHTLRSFLVECCPGEGDEADSRPLVLILDQFEEVFTTHRDRWQDAEGFFQQVREALDALPELGVVLVMREDHLAELDPYASLFPRRLRARFRMERLGPKGALAAIRRPAENAGCQYDAGVAERLVDDLRRTKVQRHVGEETMLGPFVEPVQLQVVCSQLWDKLPEQEDRAIQWEEVEEYGNVDRALTGFYEGALEQTCQLLAGEPPENLAGTRVTERQLRRWFSEQLITPMGTRSLVLRGPEETATLPNAAVDALQSQHIIRADARAGTRWYELAHDRLVEPVLESNRTWEATYRNPLASATRAWLEAGRDPQDLLKEPQLAESQAYAHDHPAELLAEEREFLAESIRQKERERQRALQASRRRRNVTIAVALVMIVLALLTVWSLTNARRATARQLSAQAETAFSEENYHLATLLALEANRLDDREGLDVLGRAPYQARHYEAILLAGHTKAVYSVAWHPDGRTLASGGRDDLIILWDVGSGEAVATLEGEAVATREGHAGFVENLAWHPDGRTLASGGRDGLIILWDVGSGEAVATLEGHRGTVESVAWHPDGRTLASGGSDPLIILWDVGSGEAIATLEGHTVTVTSVAWHPDGHTLASAGEDGRVILWDVESEEKVATLKKYTGSVYSLAWDPDGRTLASGGGDGRIVLWDVESGEAVATLEGHTVTVTSVAWHPDGHTLASAGEDGRVILWDVESEEKVAILEGHGESWAYWSGVCSVAWHPDGHTLASGGDDGRVILWGVESGEAAVTLTGHTDPANSMCWAPGGHTLASGGDDRRVILWDVESGEAVATLEGHPGPVRSVAWAPDGRTLAAGGGDGLIILWDVESEEKVATLEGHTNSVYSLAWHPDGRTLAAGGRDGLIILWDVERGEKVSILEGGTGTLLWSGGSSVAWHPDGHTLAYSHREQVILWDIESGKEVATLEMRMDWFGDEVSSMAWHPDGRILASGGTDGRIVLWDVESGRGITSLKTPKRRFSALPDPSERVQVTGLAWHPDGRILASGGTGGRVILWDVESGEAAVTLEGHAGEVRSVAWHPEGQTLASAGEDPSVRLLPEIFARSPCEWLVGNLSVYQWLTYRGSALYRPTCENLRRPEIPGPVDAWSSEDGTLWVLLLTLQGRLLLVGVAALFLTLVALVLWGVFRLGRWVLRRARGSQVAKP